MGVEPAAEKLFAIQQGMATRSQLLAAGVTESALAWRLGRVWKLVLPGVVLGAMGALAPYQRVLAAQLYAGPRAQVTGQVACRLHGLRPSQPISAVQVLVPSTCRTRDVAWARITRTNTLEERLHRHGPIWVTPPARAVVDWARGLRSHRDARALTIEAIQRRLVTIDELVHELERGPRRHSAHVRRALVDAAAGAWSDPEAQLRRLLATTRLPEPWMNPTVRRADGTLLISPDGWFDEVALAVMVHSRRYHAAADDFERTVASDTMLTTSGIIVVGIVPSQMEKAHREVVRRVLEGYDIALARPRPSVVSTPRSLFVT